MRPVHRFLVMVGSLLLAPGCHDRAPGAEARGAATSKPQPTAAPAAGSASAAPRAGSVRLVARNKLGVPLHEQPGSGGVSARLADGTEVRVEERRQGGHWLLVRAADGTRGWVTRRYVASSKAGRAPPLDSSSVWASRDKCEAALAAGRHAARGASLARIGTWNLRWFPDGHPGTHPRAEGTDLDWLACGIAWLDVDVLAVQEIKRYPEARRRVGELLGKLGALTHSRWQARFDDCPNEAGQHVGLIYNEARVSAGSFHTFASLNPHGDACKDQLRPGLGGYFRFKGGLDLHLISVHLKSGEKRRSFDLRQRSIAGIAAAYREAETEQADGDVLIAGDFNTMGCRHCSPEIPAEAELSQISRELGALSPAFSCIDTDAGCSEYYRGHGGLLDHFAVTRSLRELPAGARARVSGYCAQASCGALPERAMPAAYRRLSDHCPVLLDLADRDLD